MFTRITNKLLEPLGVKLIPKHQDRLYYQHDYGEQGFDAYRAEQVKANEAKLHWVWADARTLEVIASDVERRCLRNGLCHGARNGFEVRWLQDRLHTRVIGTDIAETAEQFPDMVVHDFHERRPDWVGQWGFIYTNSLDQAFDPRRALDAWAEQLASGGCIYIEHTMQHSPSGASEMDPFGAHPMLMPYLLFEWGSGKYRLVDILQVSEVEKKGRVWVFVIGSEERSHAAP